MSETPEHWSSETRRFAELLMREGTSVKDAGVLAIASELAELRKTLEPPPMLTATSVELTGASAPRGHIIDAPDRIAAMEQTGRMDYAPEILEMEARETLDRSEAGLRFVGWYCAGGHPLPSKMHSGQSTLGPAEPDMAVANVRPDDPCLWAVPMYVLVKP